MLILELLSRVGKLIFEAGHQDVQDLDWAGVMQFEHGTAGTELRCEAKSRRALCAARMAAEGMGKAGKATAAAGRDFSM